jgi:hypothetical protein
MNRFLTPLELLNLYFSDGASLGNKSNKLWQRVDGLLTWENLINMNYQADLAPFLYHILTKALPRMSDITVKPNSMGDLVPANAIPFLNTDFRAFQMVRVRA